MRATRRSIGMMGAALLLAAACTPAGGAQKLGKFEDASDLAIGSAKAPLTLVEYASVTCVHCREFHDQVYEQLKTNYIDTGKVRFVFREMLTAPPEVAAAGFQLARCGGATPEQYLNRVGVLFDQQTAVFQALQQGQARQVLLQVARASGLSEEQFQACITDEKGYERIRETAEQADRRYKVTGTPTLVLNGKKLEPDALSYARLSQILDAEAGKK